MSPQLRFPQFRMPAALGALWNRCKGFYLLKREQFRALDRRRQTLIVAGCVLLVLGAGLLWRSLRPGDGFSRLLIDPAYAQDNFEVSATLADSIGVEDTTAFDIRSKSAVDKGLLADSLSLTPAAPFELQQLDGNNFRLTPKAPLASKQVYRLAIASAYVDASGAKQERDYSWAFQVKDQFKVYQTLPRHEATDVPVDTGIEITFSQDNFTGWENAVTVTPNTAGRFEKHGRTLAFVPDSLAAGTLYTVTVSKELALDGSAERLAQDYVFQFETDSAGAARGAYNVFDFEKEFSEFSAGQPPVFGVYQFDMNISSLPVEVYAFRSEEQLLGALARRDGVPYWARYTRETYLEDVSGLDKVAAVTLPLSQYTYQQFFTLPEALPRGYYLVRMQAGNLVRQAYFQVSDTAVYADVTATGTLVWVNDLRTQQPVGGAKISVVGAGEQAVTGADGTAVFNTQSALGVQAGEYQSRYLRVEADGFAQIVPLNIDGGTKVSWDSYWYYFYNDRSVYKPTDTINFWGFIQRRDGAAAGDKVKVRLTAGNNRNYFYEPIVISETEVELKDGALTGKLALDDLTPGYYYLEYLLGEEVVGTQYISIMTYTKPAYQLEVTSERAAVSAGEDAVFRVKASFFEGTPVADLGITYSYYSGQSWGGEVKTDANGVAEVRIPTAYTDCANVSNCWWPRSVDVSFRPTLAEEGEITGTASVRVIGPKLNPGVEFTSENNRGRAVITASWIDIDRVNRGEDFAAGPIAANVAFSAELMEATYTKVQTGTSYDFINKIVRPEYRYDTTWKSFARFSGVTDAQGRYGYDFNMGAENSYELKLTMQDGNGRNAYLERYLYSYDDSATRSDQYALRFKDKDKQESGRFALDETVEMELVNNNQSLPADRGRYLFFRLRQGLLDYQLGAQSAYSFVFEEKFIPNLFVKGVWFDGKNYRESSSSWWGKAATLVEYDRSERALDIEVTSDRDNYAPGDEVTLRAVVKDKDGNPVQAQLNLSLVDEAFFELSGETVHTLDSLYQNQVSAGELSSYATHEMPVGQNGAEKGGCFTAGTRIRMADGSEKTIETIAPGDEILTFENGYAHKLVPARVAETFHHRVGEYLVINERLEVTPAHRVFLNNGWQQIGEARVGDFLTDERGERVRIDSIRRVQGIADVYNLSVEGYHTFLAEGFYVHNDKDGGREDFVDTALFTSLRTDANGRAEAKFTLPDNLTSWRVTAQAVSDRLFAGNSTAQVAVSLPVFVTETFAGEYLAADRPIIKLNSYGTALKTGDDVSYMLSAASLGLNEWAGAGKAFTPQYVPLPALSVGTHKLTASVKFQDQTDKMTLPLTVLESRLREQDQNFYELSVGLKPSGASEGGTEVVFSDKNRGQFYNRLSALEWTSGDRVDQRLARVLAAELKQEYFASELAPEDFEGGLYQQGDGGIALLPYGGADPELSAQVAAVASDHFDRSSLANYFYNLLADQSATGEQLGWALFGLSSLGEPVLVPLQHFAAAAELTPQARMYAALALYQLGDQEKARDLYQDFLDRYAESLEPYVRLKVSDQPDEVLKLTALGAVLAGGLGDQYRDRLWQYVAQESGRDILTNLEELMYIQATLPVLKAGECGFTYAAGGKHDTVTLKQGGTYRIRLTPEELRDISFSDLKGNVGVVTVFERQAAGRADSPYVSVRRVYEVNGQPTDALRENDLVKVVLTPEIAAEAPGQDYQLTDLLPSGLKVVTAPYRLNQYYDPCVRHPFEIDGQSVKFYLGKSWLHEGSCGNKLSYYARVASLGQYAAEPATLQSLEAAEVISRSAAGTLTIRQR